MTNLDQLPAEARIRFVQGDDYALDVEIQDDSGNPIDFSTWSNVKLQVRELEKNGGKLQQEYTQSGSLTVTAGGRLQVTFDSGDTSSWDQYNEYEVEGVDSDGNKRSILRGQVNVLRQISQ
jgi:hypothetical protein